MKISRQISVLTAREFGDSQAPWISSGRGAHGEVFQRQQVQADVGDTARPFIPELRLQRSDEEEPDYAMGGGHELTGLHLKVCSHVLFKRIEHVLSSDCIVRARGTFE